MSASHKPPKPCWWLFHKWTKWAFDSTFTGWMIGKRRCARCGQIQEELFTP